MYMPIDNWDGQITECELHKIIDTCVFWLNKQLYFQFHYSYSFGSHVNMVNMAWKRRKVLTLVEPLKLLSC